MNDRRLFGKTAGKCFEQRKEREEHKEKHNKVSFQTVRVFDSGIYISKNLL